MFFSSQIGKIFVKFGISILSVGPIPSHISFIMDGNRRFAKKKNTEEVSGYRAGFSSSFSNIMHLYDLGVKYVSVYGFSIDNFNRKPDQVEMLMDFMLEKIITEETTFCNNGIRVYFIGDLTLLEEPIRIAANNLMQATANFSDRVLLICVAYTSTNEIVHAVEQSCADKGKEMGENMAEKGSAIKVVDIEKHMYMSVAPDPDLMIRSSGETRLSNFLLWQTGNCQLYSPKALWPEIGKWHVLWGILIYQRNHAYLEKKNKMA